MKTTSFLTLASTAVISATLLLSAAVTQAAQVKPIDYRRTLTVPLGEARLRLEAPHRTCFLDSTKFTEGSAVRYFSRVGGKGKKTQFIAAFADCNLIANLGNAAEQSDSVRGIIRWANPRIGEKTDLPLQDYLDMREINMKRDLVSDLFRMSGMLDDARNFFSDDETAFFIAEDYAMDKTPKRTHNGVFVGFSAEFPHLREGIYATTSLRGYPVEIYLIRDRGSMSGGDLYDLADRLLAQEIALNNVEPK